MPGKLVKVTVARRKSIYLNASQIPGLEPNSPGQFFGPGSEILVEESELARLHKGGFIVDPHAKQITKSDIEAADLSGYVPGDVSVTEDTEQSIVVPKKGRG